MVSSVVLLTTVQSNDSTNVQLFSDYIGAWQAKYHPLHPNQVTTHEQITRIYYEEGGKSEGANLKFSIIQLAFDECLIVSSAFWKITMCDIILVEGK